MSVSPTLISIVPAPRSRAVSRAGVTSTRVQLPTRRCGTTYNAARQRSRPSLQSEGRNRSNASTVGRVVLIAVDGGGVSEVSRLCRFAVTLAT
jgi:hypothetical protein